MQRLQHLAAAKALREEAEQMKAEIIRLQLRFETDSD